MQNALPMGSLKRPLHNIVLCYAILDKAQTKDTGVLAVHMKVVLANFDAGGFARDLAVTSGVGRSLN